MRLFPIDKKVVSQILGKNLANNTKMIVCLSGRETV